MKNPHASLLLLAALLTSGCAAQSPPSFKEVVKDATKNRNLPEAASESPRVIRVSVDAKRNVFFRKERVGTVDGLGPLKERVKQAIEKNRLDAHDAEDAAHSNTVFFCAPETFKYGDVVPVIDAVKEVGGNPVSILNCDPPR